MGETEVRTILYIGVLVGFIFGYSYLLNIFLLKNIWWILVLVVWAIFFVFVDTDEKRKEDKKRLEIIETLPRRETPYFVME